MADTDNDDISGLDSAIESIEREARVKERQKERDEYEKERQKLREEQEKEAKDNPPETETEPEPEPTPPQPTPYQPREWIINDRSEIQKILEHWGNWRQAVNNRLPAMYLEYQCLDHIYDCLSEDYSEFGRTGISMTLVNINRLIITEQPHDQIVFNHQPAQIHRADNGDIYGFKNVPPPEEE